ncbi:hypothetical protein [Aliiglaciecola sp. M165]|uniref:hypothetical protein n=1 Tax=Aliiglaciecola sp. M165 TaxID=2593649 RepID=UPI00117E54D8|nr:hypothetical protein [Aliiglaciecola sp. M165]TRY33401.1 hypothetical protein FM019_05350 [Aliiglaciecola sp. M165]
MKRYFDILLVAFFLFTSTAHANFGATKVTPNLKAGRLYVGKNLTYLTFSSPLEGCNIGGYAATDWPAANGGSVDSDKTDQLISVFLFAKAQNASFEVRYRVNQSGNGGWNSCAIDNIYLN